MNQLGSSPKRRKISYPGVLINIATFPKLQPQEDHRKTAASGVPDHCRLGCAGVVVGESDKVRLPQPRHGLDPPPPERGSESTHIPEQSGNSVLTLRHVVPPFHKFVHRHRFLRKRKIITRIFPCH